MTWKARVKFQMFGLLEVLQKNMVVWVAKAPGWQPLTFPLSGWLWPTPRGTSHARVWAPSPPIQAPSHPATPGPLAIPWTWCSHLASLP